MLALKSDVRYVYPPDVPFPCRGLPPGAPCPWPDDCACNREPPKSYRVLLLSFVSISILLSIIMAFIVIFTVVERALGADNNPPCLTREQAREKYPGQWLYWRTARHCWYGAHFAKPVRTHKTAKMLPVDANGNAVSRPAPADMVDKIQYDDEASRRLHTCCWPPLPKFIPWEERIKP